MEQLHNTPMTNNFDKEKFTKFASEKLKSTGPFVVKGNYFGEVEVYVHKVGFSFLGYRDGRMRVDARFDFKFKQIAEPTGWRYGWNKNIAGRRRNEQIRHQIAWVRDNEISIMCKIFGINYVGVDKITESKSNKKKI